MDPTFSFFTEAEMERRAAVRRGSLVGEGVSSSSLATNTATRPAPDNTMIYIGVGLLVTAAAAWYFTR